MAGSQGWARPTLAYPSGHQKLIHQALLPVLLHCHMLTRADSMLVKPQLAIVEVN